MIAPSRIPHNWWELLDKVEHDWGEVEVIRPYGDDYECQFCQTCDAIRFIWDGKPSTPQFHSCRVTTDYPGDDAPCLCTRGGYLEAHGLLKDQKK